MEDIRFGFGIQWHLTDTCDQRCKHCYVWQDKKSQRKEALDLKKCQVIIDNVANFGIKRKLEMNFALTGGDPLLFPFFWEVAIMINEKGWEWTILGNPFHLNLDVALNLKELGCTRYQMSIDGIRKTHDSIRKKGSFDSTLEKIKILKEVGIIPLVMTTVFKENIDEIPEVTRICVDNGVELLAFARYGGNSPNGIAPMRYKKFLEEMYQLYLSLKGKGCNFSYKDHLWKLFFFENGMAVIDKKNEEIVDGCHCGFGHLSILPNGDVYACRRFDSLVGNALENSIDNIFLSDKMEEYRNVDEMECGSCELKLYCRGCPAVSHGEYGDWKRKDPQCWKELT
jgi:radical SAM/SPASM domain protein of ACGX system